MEKLGEREKNEITRSNTTDGSQQDLVPLTTQIYCSLPSYISSKIARAKSGTVRFSVMKCASCKLRWSWRSRCGSPSAWKLHQDCVEARVFLAWLSSTLLLGRFLGDSHRVVGRPFTVVNSSRDRQGGGRFRHVHSIPAPGTVVVSRSSYCQCVR